MFDSHVSIFPNERFMDLSLYQCGFEKCSPLHSYGPYIRNHYLFHYILSGSGTFTFDLPDGSQQTCRLHGGEGFMIFPHQVTTYFADQEHPWEYVWVEFDGLKASEYLTLSGITATTPLYRSNDKKLTRELKDELLYIAGNPEKSPLHLIGHLYLFLDDLMNSSAARKNRIKESLADYYIREAISFLEQYYQNDISVEDLARFCGLNRSYFSKIFREKMGRTPQEFLIHYRMDKAAAMLRLTSLSIGDISNAVGYHNQLHFSRAFKNTYDISPRQWRNENKLR